MFEHSVHRPNGAMITVGPDGCEVHSDTLQCAHCGGHWQVQPGSGKIRGFCTRCMAPVCGAPNCFECVPFEQKMDLLEKGKILTL
jgi:hypothetical protein